MDPHSCLLAACSLFMKGRSSLIFAAFEHVQDLTVQCPGRSSRALRHRFHMAKSIPAAKSPGTWSVREQETQNPGNGFLQLS